MIRGLLSFNREIAGAVLLASTLFATTGCELVGNIDKRSLAAAAQSDGGSSDDGGPTTGTPSTDLSHCTLTGSGTGLVRFGNLVPTFQRVDFCLRPSTASNFDGIKPLFASAGPSCAAGLGYEDITRSIAMPKDTYEVNVIPAGQGCDAVPLATLSSALVPDKQATALHLLGNGRQAPTLRRYAESRPSQPGSTTTRLYNAAADLGTVDFGLTADASIPTKIVAPRILKLGFGDATPNDPSQTAVDANGYVTQQAGSGQFSYGVAPTGTTDATLAISRTLASGTSFSFFAVGRTDTPDFPLELFGCDEVATSSGVLANCHDAPAVTFVADNVNVQLSGAFTVVEQPRRPVAIDAVSKLTSDYVCVTEIYQKSDKDALVAAAKSQFPYSYSPPTDETTEPTDDRNLAGDHLTRPTTPPCAASSKMTGLVDCMAKYCSTSTSDDTGVAVPDATTCISKFCASRVLGIANGTNDDKTCWGCVFATYNSYEKMSDIRNLCTTDPNIQGFRGASGTMILSRRPLSNTGFFLMPVATTWTTTVAKASTTLDNGAVVDLYCGTGVGVPTDCTLFNAVPPIGANADGTLPKDCIGAGLNQQILYNTRIRDFIAKTSGQRRAKTIFSADIYEGPGYQDSVQALYPDNFALLSAAFSLGTAPNYVPSCTDCADNPIRTPPGGTVTGANTWTRFNFLQNLPVTAVQSNEVFLKDPIVAANPGNGATMIPISSYYAFRSVLTIVP